MPRPTADRSRGAAVRLRGIVKQYGAGAPAVNAVSLDIAAGEFISLLGPSGSGKTTTLNAIAGFIDIDAGEIELGGVAVASMRPHLRNIGMVFQHFTLFPHMTVAENVAYPLRQRKVPAKERARRVQAALEMVQLGEYGTRRPDQLSGGQQQRVAVARAVVFEPRVLLMDEPFGALDRKLREELQIQLKGLHRELGITIIFVTHDQEEALVLSDRIAVFNNGSIDQIGTPAELYDRPENRFVAQFLGESNIFEGTVRDVDGVRALVCPDGRFVLPAPAADPGTEIHAMVRPEKCRVAPVGPDGDGLTNALEGEVEEEIFLGSSRKLLVRTPTDRVVTVRSTAAADRGVSVGSKVVVTWDSADLLVVR
ncbi:ABC transporter ATP-binding protein [Microbispora sp. H11081]|uniref:ABC transporter ATP-binding protein n=1 Tax=Microbispora sp. H11081 TaxID=2729107 RepID=UPI0014731CE1|nr:ABC transporter ATP-binding protein [Microbispora sp. H11081]